MNGKRILKWIGITLGALLALIVVAIIAVVLFFDWNWLKGPLANAVVSATGRTLEVDNIAGQWRLHPRVRLEQVKRRSLMFRALEVSTSQPARSSQLRLEWKLVRPRVFPLVPGDS